MAGVWLFEDHRLLRVGLRLLLSLSLSLCLCAAESDRPFATDDETKSTATKMHFMACWLLFLIYPSPLDFLLL